MLQPPRRLFIGLMPGKQVQYAIQRHCREWTWPPEARPTRFGRYHLTLHFLGEVGAAPESRLRKALREVVMEPLQLELCFPRPGHVAMLRPAAHDGLDSLHQRIATAIVAAGLRPGEREFLPHVTLARNASHAVPPASVTPIQWHVEEFALVWSVLFPQARPARYEVVESHAATAGETRPASSGQPGEQQPLI